MTPEQLREVEFWLAQHTAGRADLDLRTIAAILAVYAGVNFYDDVAVQAAAEQAADVSNTATILVAGLMAQYLATVTSTMTGEDLPVPAVLLAPLRYGADMDRVFQRPIKMFRRKVSEGMSPEKAFELAMKYAATLTEANNTLAMRDATVKALEDLGPQAGITGYRRVLRPELSKTGSCGLCIVASDQVYKRKQLMPLHENCNCDVLPIVGAKNGPGDPGNSFNNLDLKAIYAQSDSTSGEDLKKVRIQVNIHGEYGPSLGRHGQKFTNWHDLGLPARNAA